MKQSSDNVRKMFSEIAHRYDLANDILTFGLHRTWYSKIVNQFKGKKGLSVLDCATGTGNLAFKFKKLLPDSIVTGVDFSEKMIELAQMKNTKKNLDVNFKWGDALNLEFPAGVFDVATISWGIRNVESPDKCLREMARVVKPGGSVVVLEFGQPRGFLKLLYLIYHKLFLQPVGGFLTGKKYAYSYLTETAGVFPCGDNFLSLMEQTGCFSKMTYQKLFWGIAYIYVGKVSNL